MHVMVCCTWSVDLLFSLNSHDTCARASLPLLVDLVFRSNILCVYICAGLTLKGGIDFAEKRSLPGHAGNPGHPKIRVMLVCWRSVDQADM